MNRVATAVAVVSAFTLTACGPGAKISNGKEGAAQALLAASSPTKASSDKSGGGVDLTGSISFNCPQGGTATLSGFSALVNLAGGGVDVGQKFNLAYNACGLAKADVGVAVYNGSVAVEQTIMAGSGGASVNQKMKGKVLVQGAFDDFLDADITQSIAVLALGTGNGSVSMNLVGTLSTSGGSYAYNEAINITAGTIAAELPKR